MKVVTVLGTRPEIIRLSRIIPKLDQCCDHVLVHTGQNYDPRLSDIFFSELGLRQPQHYLGARAETPMGQIAQILALCEGVLSRERPDQVLVLVDTNSALCAYVAKRQGVRVYHMEAGNRCFDDRVPEEVNRRVVDHASDILLPYTERARENLLREGIPSQRIYVTGNPIREVLDYYSDRVNQSIVVSQLGLRPKAYMLVSMHRAENVDNGIRLREFVGALLSLMHRYQMPIVCSAHPRLRSQLDKHQIDTGGLILAGPFGFHDFVSLQMNAACVLSDSGTVQEECCILSVPNVTLRDVTERPETIECGSNIVTGCDEARILAAVETATKFQPTWCAPTEYQRTNVSDTVVRILLGAI